LPQLLVRTADTQITSATGSNVTMDFLVNSKTQHHPLVATISVLLMQKMKKRLPAKISMMIL
jgi:hypothetical protein